MGKRTASGHVVGKVKINFAAIAAHAAGTANRNAHVNIGHFRNRQRRKGIGRRSAAHAPAAANTLQQHANGIVPRCNNITKGRGSRSTVRPLDIAAMTGMAAITAHAQRYVQPYTVIKAMRRTPLASA